MTCIVEENQRLLALLMIRSNLVSHLIEEISKTFEVDVLALNNVSLFRSQSHNSISNILSIVFYLGKVYEVLESFIFPSLLVVGIRDDYPYLLSWLEDIYLKAARPNG